MERMVAEEHNSVRDGDFAIALRDADSDAAFVVAARNKSPLNAPVLDHPSDSIRS